MWADPRARLEAWADGIRRPLSIAAAAWAEDRRHPRPRRNADELAFLPSALELVETPASPAGRAVMAAVMALAVAALAWSVLGRVDIHATAQGRIVPVGRTKMLAAAEISTVKAILARDGDRVAAGQVLVELDPTMAAADAARLARDLAEAQVTAARLHAQLQGSVDFAAPDGAGPQLVATHRALLASTRAEQQAALDGLERELEQRQAEARALESEVARLEQTVPLLDQRRAAKAELAEKGYAARTEVLMLTQDWVDRSRQLDAARHRRAEAQAAIRATEDRRRQTLGQVRAEALRQLAEAEQKAAAAAQDLAKAEQRRRLTRLAAPVDGVVQQMAVHTVGGVVREAEPLLAVVPDDGPVAVEAFLPNKDVGFVLPGQSAEIKLEPFPFTRYGTVPGMVETVSRDTVQSQDLDARTAQPSPDRPPEETRPLYQVRVRPLAATMAIDGHPTALTPGMAVTVEIRTGNRRVIDYLLDPVLKRVAESARER